MADFGRRLWNPVLTCMAPDHERPTWIGQSVDAAGGPAARHRARRVRRRHQFSASASHAHRALGACAWPHRRHHTARRARCPASMRCGPQPTSPTCRRSISARARSRRSILIASRCWQLTACAMSAIRSPRCSPPIPTSPRTPPTVTAEIEELPPLLDAQAAPAEFSPGHSSEGGDHPPGLWRRRRGVPRRAACGRGRSRHRPAFRRAAGNARRHRPLRRFARHSRTARRRQGAAPQSGTALPHARHSAEHDPCPRVPCRRRLRHSRRALSGRRAGLRRRQKIQPRGEMDRGPARASDRRQSFAPAVAERIRAAVDETA